MFCDATQAILAGRPLQAVANQLNEQGHKTSTGKPWTYMRLRDVLVRPRNAGLIHRGRADRRHESREDQPMRFEVIGQADWPADTWRPCPTMLLDPSRRIHTSTEPRWLGSRSDFCGVEGCGAPRRPTSKTDGNAKRLYHYMCSELNHLSFAAVKIDDWVRELVAQMVRDPRVAAGMEPGDDGHAADKARRQVLVGPLEQTERDYDNDLIDARRYKAKSDRITRRDHGD